MSNLHNVYSNPDSLEKEDFKTSEPSIRDVTSKDLEMVDSSHRVEPDFGFDPEFLKKTMKKVDLRLVPILAALYSISLVDRTNISLAAVAGMAVELQLLVDERYSIALLLFFVPYILFEVASNIFLRKFGAARWMSFAGLSFGAIMVGMAFVESWVTLAICRVLVGIFEAAIFPGCVYLTSCWYVRKEMQIRLSSFYMVSVLISGFSSIWAYGLTQIPAKGMLDTWRWIFFVQGLVTIAIAIAAFFLVVDFPDKATFLTEEQRALVTTRIQRDRGDAAPDALTAKKCLTYAMDLRLWAFGINFGCSTISSYAFSYFLPLILRSFGFSVRDSQLLVAPPYVFAVLLALTCAKLSDRWSTKIPFIIFNALIVIVGLALVAFVPHTPANPMVGARYAGVFLGVAGCNSNVAFTLGQASASIVGQSKRGYTSALQVMAGGIGGIIASTVFKSAEAPNYRTGISVALGASALVVVIQIVLAVFFANRNKKARNGSKLIENTPGFYYTL